MAVPMKRSTKSAPESLSTSYLIGSAFIGISITTLKSSGTARPELTRSKPIGWNPALLGNGKPIVRIATDTFDVSRISWHMLRVAARVAGARERRDCRLSLGVCYGAQRDSPGGTSCRTARGARYQRGRAWPAAGCAAEPHQRDPERRAQHHGRHGPAAWPLLR